jgi:small basic protein
MIIAVIGIIIGLGIGYLIPLSITTSFSIYFSVAILAAIDSVFGAIRTSREGTFDMVIFVSGFFTNAILAAFLAYIGDNLGVPIYYAAVFAFGVRLFNNLAIIRRDIITSYRQKMTKNT